MVDCASYWPTARGGGGIAAGCYYNSRIAKPFPRFQVQHKNSAKLRLTFEMPRINVCLIPAVGFSTPKVRLKQKIQTAGLLRVAGRFVAMDRGAGRGRRTAVPPVVRNLIMVKLGLREAVKMRIALPESGDGSVGGRIHAGRTATSVGVRK
jgi:hypothetical protein